MPKAKDTERPSLNTLKLERSGRDCQWQKTPKDLSLNNTFTPQLRISIDAPTVGRNSVCMKSMYSLSLSTLILPRIATSGGLRASSKALRKATRTEKGFGVRRTEWNRQALSAYSWMRTDRGPQKEWLHCNDCIDKADSPAVHAAIRRRTETILLSVAPD